MSMNVSKSMTLAAVLMFVCNAVLSAEDSEQSPFAVPSVDAPRPTEHVMGWVDSRDVVSLNGSWKFLVDPMQVGTPGSLFGGWATTRTPEDEYQLLEYSYANAADIRVPGDFNTQFDELLYYRDTVWYQRRFDIDQSKAGRYHLWFGGANYETTIYLNGQAVAHQSGGYVPFSVDVTDHLLFEGNDLIVQINNRLDADTVPTERTDWWPYGGLTRDVMLIHTPEAYIVNASVQLDDDLSTISGHVKTHGMGAGHEVEISLPEINVRATVKTDDAGVARFKFDAPVSLWSPSNPKLYEVRITSDADQISDRLGFRTIAVNGKQILLNGEPIRFKGISTHEEPIGRDGVAYSRADVDALFGEAKELGVNFIRAAHYPYSRHAAKAADEMGLLLWEEVPIYWNINWENPETLRIARDQIARLVQRDWNRASVVVWSVANETTYSEPRMAFLNRLIQDVRKLDDTRLVSAALLGDTRRELQHVVTYLAANGLGSDIPSENEKLIFQQIIKAAGENAPKQNSYFNLLITDPLGELVDLVSYNEYFGWYYSRFIADQTGVSEHTIRLLMLDLMPRVILASAFDKPMFISEFGAGAKAGKRGDGVWTEDYQADVYRAQFKMISNSPQVQGMTPWILKDFRAMLRSLGGVQDFRNRKGLIDENGRRKQAFYVLRDFYAGDWGHY